MGVTIFYLFALLKIYIIWNVSLFDEIIYRPGALQGRLIFTISRVLSELIMPDKKQTKEEAEKVEKEEKEEKEDKEEEEAEPEDDKNNKDKKHDSGAADLEKVITFRGITDGMVLWSNHFGP